MAYSFYIRPQLHAWPKNILSNRSKSTLQNTFILMWRNIQKYSPWFFKYVLESKKDIKTWLMSYICIPLYYIKQCWILEPKVTYKCKVVWYNEKVLNVTVHHDVSKVMSWMCNTSCLDRQPNVFTEILFPVGASYLTRPQGLLSRSQSKHKYWNK